jgi:very-short-patch-repair endonuclease
MDPLRRITAGHKVALARALRRAPTPAERYAWSLLRNRGVLGLKFRRQHVLHGFIVDFYCAARRLVVELEGDSHTEPGQRAYDAARTAFLQAAGYRVISLKNRDVTRERLEAVLRQALGEGPEFPLSRRERGPGGEDPREGARG